MKQRHISIGLAVVLVMLVVAGCAAKSQSALLVSAVTDHQAPAGFLLGLWHGIIAPFAFVISLFNSNVGVYEINNNGHWYDLGFLLGVAATFGGSANRVAAGKKG